MKIAIIGAGKMAKAYISVAQSLNFNIVGLHSRTLETAKSLSCTIGCKAYQSIEELYNHTKADIVINTCSELAILNICKEIFKYPWICLLEKPVGINYEESLKIKILAEDTGSKCFVALNRRFYSSTINLQNRLLEQQSKRLIEITDQQDLVEAKETDNFPDQVLENFMYVNSIHLIDYIQQFARGEIESIKQVFPWNNEEPDFMLVVINYSSGDIVIYKAYWNRPGPWTVSVTTDDLRLELSPLERISYRKRYSHVIHKVEDDQDDLNFKPGLRKLCEELQKEFKDNKSNLTTLNDGIRSMLLVKEIYGI
jgi:predicted dehydrogenase